MQTNKECFPRPDMVREDWMDLNGTWKFRFDDKKEGERQCWFKEGLPDAVKIRVPYCYQSQASGVEDKGYHEVMWYERSFIFPEKVGRHCLMHFGAADYETKVWINGCYAGGHKGGNCIFSLDITDYVIYGEQNKIVVKCTDSNSNTQPRGKQFWKEKGERIWYTPVSGIWKNIWLEFTGSVYLEKILITPDIDRRCINIELRMNHWDSHKEYFITALISHERELIKKAEISLSERNSTIIIGLPESDYVDEIHYWTPENPWLYDMELSVMENGKEQDKVFTYFGMRKISVRGKQILLNNKPYYQRLVLDQGYWKDTLMTPSGTEVLEKDILLAKEMGFNGARKHQKIEDARYYYLADKLGFLVWGELPSAYQFCTEEMGNLTEEWKEVILELYNHPSVVMWVPLNESWGVRNIVSDKKQQTFARQMYFLTKALDSSRLVSSNDGWEQIEDSDICGIHDYTSDGQKMLEKFADFEACARSSAEHRLLYGDGQNYKEKPILITEFGGIAFESENEEEWGYYGTVKDDAEFFERFEGVVSAISNLKEFSGFCYTQLTDVFQETNGLLNFDRSSKVSLKRIKEIVEQK